MYFVVRFLRIAGFCLLAICLGGFCSCANVQFGALSYATEASDPLVNYRLSGNTAPVLDPSIIRQKSTYYVFSTDIAGVQSSGNLQIRSSTDLQNWTFLGTIFPSGIPQWITQRIPGVIGLWGPDVSYFDGEYHVYYSASILHTQRSVIALATNRTLDPTSSDYKWVDRGLVIESRDGDDFNALDPSVLIDEDGSVWLTYGSYWSGIKQRQIDRATGLLLASNPTRFELAARPGVPHNPIEGASLVHHGNYYYLFVSVDYCCESTIAEDNYKQAVGRSLSPHGPFVGEDGTPMLDGGGTILLKGNSSWNAPGGGTAFIDQETGASLLVFHAQNLANDGKPYQWIKSLEWQNDWPVFADQFPARTAQSIR